MKYIFVTGGVVSSLGKGLTAASLGTLLENRGLKVALQKFDPYLNVDPGTMSPYQHGEVYVLDDGAETDLDLGHYERFTNVKLTRLNNLTSGQVYQTVSNNEREGEYLGKTVQVIPHVTDEIQNRIHMLAEQTKADVVITEIGGTTGDIEGLPFLEAIREFALEVGYSNVVFLHVTYVPFIKAAGELKTKPTQQSVAKLREIGIAPHILVCRCEQPLDKELRQKISLFCNVPYEAVIEEKDVDHSIYEVPLMLQRERMDDLVCQLLHLDAPAAEHDALAGNHPQAHRPATSRPHRGGRQIHRTAGRLQIGLRSDHPRRRRQRLRRGNSKGRCRGNRDATAPEKHLERPRRHSRARRFWRARHRRQNQAAQYARENNIPYLGLCLGMQIATIEFARNVLEA